MSSKVGSWKLVSSEGGAEEGSVLGELRRALALNRATQQQLKAVRDVVRVRMGDIAEFISSFRIANEYPPRSAILSYIKFERNVSPVYKDQYRISEQPAEPKARQDEDAEFMIKLHQAKVQKKKQMLSVDELPVDPLEIDFFEICKGTQFRCGIDLYRAWHGVHRRAKEPKRLFTLEEDQYLETLHRMYGENWEKICQYLETRTLDELYYEYHNRINPNLSPGRWTIRQTLMLIVLIEHYGARRWANISQKIVAKSELQVRERYCNLIDPTIGKDVWTAEMEKRLLELAEENEYCWKKISLMPIFKNKTDNCIWRKYKQLMVRFTEEEIHEQLPPVPRTRGLADKIIKEKRVVDSRKRAARNRPQPPIYYNSYRPKDPPLPTSTSVLPAPSLLLMEAEEENFFNDFSENRQE